MSNEIKIVIGGDASQFVGATKQANDAMGTFTGLTNQTSSSLRKVATESVTAAESIKKVTTAASKDIFPDGSLAEARASIKRLKQEIENLSGVQLKSDAGKFLVGELKVAEAELKALETQAGLSSANTGNLLKQGFSGLRTIANILPGIGVAGLIGFATEPIINYVSSLIKAKDETAGFAKAMEDALKQAGDELARVQVLNAVISDNTRKQSERSNAAKELSGILKDLNINLSKEAILNGDVAEATKKATEAILSRAKARAAENRISELSGQQLQRDIKRKAAVDNLAKATADLNTQEQIRKQVIGGNSLGVSGNTIAATQNVISLQKEVKTLDSETAKANDEIKQLVGTITSSDLNVDFKGGTEKEVDLLKQRIAALKEIQSLQGLDAKQQVELVQLEIKLVNRDGPKLSFSPAEIKQQADAILEKAFPTTTFEYDTIVTTRVNKLIFSAVKDAAALTEGFKTDIAKAIGIDGPIEVPAPPVTITGAAAELQKAIEKTKALIVETTVEVSDIIGESLAAALNGEKIGAILANAAKGLMNIVGGILQEVGKNMILTSTAVETLTTALNALFLPGGAIAGIAAGALLVTIGALVKNIDIPAFANGGVVNRPTFGLFGEAGPEAIMPLSKIPDLVRNLSTDNNNTVMLAPTLRFSLTDMALGLERVRSSRHRLG